jgi:hypothetical protein
MTMIGDGGFSSSYDVVKDLTLKLGAVGVGVQLRGSHCARECMCMDGYVHDKSVDEQVLASPLRVADYTNIIM